jgi:glycerol-3-phosphate dehydrogenase (NAD(P)+)
LYDVLFHSKSPKEAVDSLMMRSRTHESEDLRSLVSDRYALDEKNTR